MPAEGCTCLLVHTSRPVTPGAGRFVYGVSMRTVIIANGDPPAPSDIACWLRKDDRLICADGGAKVALRLNLKPHIVVGDFDSLSADDLAALVAGGAQVHRYPPRKNETDLELALTWAVRGAAASDRVADRAGSGEIVVLGARGGRIDHELANILLLAMPMLWGWRVIMAHGQERLRLIDARTGVATLTIRASVGDTVSLIPFGGDAIGVRTDGLEYPLCDESLAIGPARGVSNVMLGNEATVSLRAGMLLCVVMSACPE